MDCIKGTRPPIYSYMKRAEMNSDWEGCKNSRSESKIQIGSCQRHKVSVGQQWKKAETGWSITLFGSRSWQENNMDTIKETG